MLMTNSFESIEEGVETRDGILPKYQRCSKIS